MPKAKQNIERVSGAKARPKKVKPVSEAAFKKAVCDYLAVLESQGRLFYWRQQSGGIKVGARWISMGRKGLPDLVVLLECGEMIGVELKKVGGKPEASQLEVQEMWRKLGHKYFILTHSIDWKMDLECMVLS